MSYHPPVTKVRGPPSQSTKVASTRLFLKIFKNQRIFIFSDLPFFSVRVTVGREAVDPGFKSLHRQK